MYFIEAAKKVKRAIFNKLKLYWRYRSKYKLEGKKKDKEVLLYVLAGYKDYLWDDVFFRIRQFQLPNMEVCIASSGKYSKELSNICKQNDWCYLSTSLNNICVLTNIILRVFSKSTYYFKLDEDIYLPDNYFGNMIEAYRKIESAEKKHVIGYICPFQPIGPFSMYDYLVEKNRLNDFKTRFGSLYVGGIQVNPFFRNNVGIDPYIWNQIGVFDDEALRYYKKGFSYSICPMRTAIAAILFKRDFWDRMGSLKAPRGVGWGIGGDEEQITSFCACNYLAIFRVDNIFIGHFAIGGAEKSVLELKKEHPEYFKFKDIRDGVLSKTE